MIVERIKSSQNKNLIARAASHQNRLRFHTETNLERIDAKAAGRFLEWVESLIPKEKYVIFLALFQFPVSTNELVDSIYTELNRVFHGRNRVTSYQFTDNKYRDDWEWYKSEKLDLNKKMQDEAWQRMKTAINSVVVVDLPESQAGTLPEPYFYYLDIENVIGFDYDREKNVINWIAFEQDDEQIAYVDHEQYAIYSQTKGNYSEQRRTLHNLGYCPATFMWEEELREEVPELKKAPLSKHLAKLDWLLFFETSKHHLDLYAPYPIYAAYEQDCDFQNPETGEFCDSGFLKNDTGEYLFSGMHGTVRRCPVCDENKPTGVGAMIQVPQPETGGVDMRNPVTITTVDATSLTYNVKEVERLKSEIYFKAVGLGGENMKEAINVEQVKAGFESKQAVLQLLKSQFETLEMWITDTICRLRYGPVFLSANINYGTEFYVYDIENLYTQYKSAKENGAGDILLDGIMDKIIETEHLNNPAEMQRAYILKHLEPYRHLTKNEVMDLYKEGFADRAEVMLKVNFSNLVRKFERENTNIIEFGSRLDFQTKINIIKKELISYDSKEETSGQSQNGLPANNTNHSDKGERETADTAN